MGIAHGRADILGAEQFLDFPQILSHLVEDRGRGVAQPMRGDLPPTPRALQAARSRKLGVLEKKFPEILAILELRTLDVSGDFGFGRVLKRTPTEVKCGHFRAAHGGVCNSGCTKLNSDRFLAENPKVSLHYTVTGSTRSKTDSLSPAPLIARGVFESVADLRRKN